MAKKNKFQHATVPNSAYYNATTQPDTPDRIRAEGYTAFSVWAENISTGLQTSESTYVAWWNSTEHRGNMNNATFQEIGMGFYFLASSGLAYYWTMDLTAGAPSYVTDTLFYDANGNGKYTQGEGVSGVRVFLKVNGAEHTLYDVSAAAGSFAIPLTGIAVGTTAEVWLTNQNATAVNLSIPRDYRTLETMTLTPAQSTILGTFTRSAFGVNFGFRNLIKSTGTVVAPVLTLTRSGGNMQFSWPSQTGLQYLPQWSPNLSSAWTDFTGGYRNGTGAVMSQSDAATATRKYYRVVVRRP
jgi:hypothetical protein